MSRQLILVIEEIPDNSSLIESSKSVVFWSAELAGHMSNMSIGRLEIRWYKDKEEKQTRI